MGFLFLRCEAERIRDEVGWVFVVYRVAVTAKFEPLNWFEPELFWTTGEAEGRANPSIYAVRGKIEFLYGL